MLGSFSDSPVLDILACIQTFPTTNITIQVFLYGYLLPAKT